MSLTLPYSFPRAASEEPEPALSRDAFISRNLEFDREPVKVQPKVAHEPYVKTFNLSNSNTPESFVIPGDDPIDDILKESQHLIANFDICLPYSDMTPSPKKQPSPRKAGTATLERKRSRAVLERIDHKLANNSVSNSPTKTPTHQSTRNLQPNSSSKKPKADRLSPSAEQKLFGQRKLSFSLKAAAPKSSLADSSFAEHSVVDPLACHADNIMRMAMDSTMLESFCNNSISSNFSNLLDDSIVGKRPPEIYEDKSISEHTKKPTSVLDPQRARKVEISAEDLENAVNNPFRLP